MFNVNSSVPEKYWFFFGVEHKIRTPILCVLKQVSSYIELGLSHHMFIKISYSINRQIIEPFRIRHLAIFVTATHTEVEDQFLSLFSKSRKP